MFTPNPIAGAPILLDVSSSITTLNSARQLAARGERFLGLPGHGRADVPVDTTIGIFLQVIDPNAFAGLDAFTRQTGWLVDACHANPPLPGRARVRLVWPVTF